MQASATGIVKAASAARNDGMRGGRIFLGAAVLDAGRGGIARVARMTARALMESVAHVDMLSLLDTAPVTVAGSAAAAARSSKLAFTTRCHLAALRHRRFIYDSVGIARAHPRLPGLKRPYAAWMHGIEVWEALQAATKAAAHSADLLLVNSHYTRDRYLTLHPGGPDPQVCWLATEEDDEPGAARVPGPPTVLILARIDATEGYKGHQELIGCWPDVVAAVPDARLLIGGGGTGFDALCARVAASPARDNIELTGFIAEARLPEVWHQADVFAMPSRGEGFGLVYVEAMRYGLPTIASVHDAGREVNVDGVTGFNVDLDRPGELSDRIICLLASEPLRRKMGEAGRRRWRENFRYASFKSRLLPLVGDFLRGS